MFVRNAWYVAAWEHELSEGGLFTRTILGEPILLYRKSEGGLVALDNRCCHRLAPLSRGSREGDCVRCGYHGMKFDATGQCVDVPGQDSIPPSARVRQYPVVAKNRWVFVWMGDPQKADTALLPDNFSNNDPHWRGKPGYLTMNANYLLIADNLLDFSHLTYVHQNTLGGSTDIAHSKPKIDKLPQGLRLTRRIANTVPAPYHRQFGNFDGNVDRWFIYDFLVPGVLLMSSGVKPIGLADDDYSGALKLHSCQAITPETEKSTHYFFQQAHSFALHDDAISESIFNTLVVAFDEDRLMIESQQKMLDLNPKQRMVGLGADSALGQFRNLIHKQVLAEQQPQRSSVSA